MQEKDELLDIYDREMNYAGTMGRKEVHRTGALHRTFHCWFVGSSSVYFQLRSGSSDFPRTLDVTAGGHFRAGENAEQASREIEEETGISVPYSGLAHIGQNTFEFHEGEVNIHEVAEVFMVNPAGGIDIFDPDPGEVSGIVSLPFDEGKALLSGEMREFEPEAMLLCDSGWKKGKFTVTVESFVPGNIPYYGRVMEVASEFASGKSGLTL